MTKVKYRGTILVYAENGVEKISSPHTVSVFTSINLVYLQYLYVDIVFLILRLQYNKNIKH